MPTRRAVLLGGAGVGAMAVAGGVAVDQGVVPGRPWVQAQLGLNGPAGTIPLDRPGRIVSGSFVSEARGGVDTGWSIALPPGGADHLRVLVVLHGLGGNHRTAMDSLGLGRFQAAGVRQGMAPFAIASVDGGTTYWHERSNGEDAGSMVLDEFIPLLKRHDLRTDRVGLMGWSMGGYAALRLGALLGPDRCACVVAESPALWTDGASASRSGFANAAEYAAYSVMGRQSDLDGIPVRVDCGTGDPFYAATRAYVRGFQRGDRPRVSFERGAHDMDYWRRMAPAQLRFVASHLAV